MFALLNRYDEQSYFDAHRQMYLVTPKGGYVMEIEDKRTVYGECTYRLVPREDEPSVCLMHDWIYLPSA